MPNRPAALLIGALIALSATHAAEPIKKDVGTLTTSTSQVIPLVIEGEGWNQKIILNNVDDGGTAAVGTLKFFRANGDPWEIELQERGRSSEFPINLQPGQVEIYETFVRDHGQILGWAFIDQEAAGLGDLFSQTVFRKKTAGRLDLMTSVVAGHGSFVKVHILFDNSDGKFPGVGILLARDVCIRECEDVQVRLTFKDVRGNVFRQDTKTYRQRTLNRFSLVADFPETIGRIGTIEVEAVREFSTRLAGFSLQFAPNGVFTTISTFEK